MILAKIHIAANDPTFPSLFSYFLWSIGDGRGDGNGQKLFCGNSPSKRIVGGTEAPQGAWPWQAMILKRFGNNYGQWCGGTLIDPNWVVTAAHCIENIVNNNDRKIRLDKKKIMYSTVQYSTVQYSTVQYNIACNAGVFLERER